MSNTSTRFHSLFVACKFNYTPLENVGDMSEIDSLELYKSDPLGRMSSLHDPVSSTYRRTESEKRLPLFRRLRVNSRGVIVILIPLMRTKKHSFSQMVAFVGEIYIHRFTVPEDSYIGKLIGDTWRAFPSWNDGKTWKTHETCVFLYDVCIIYIHCSRF